MKCRKCAGTTVKITYVQKKIVGGSFTTALPEHLSIQCETCSFVWNEKPLDAAKEKEQP